jgi:MOSC domain-containing protein YiiM
VTGGAGRGGVFEIVSLNVSKRKGTAKEPVDSMVLVRGMGAEGDAHAGAGDRQVSLLAFEDIEAARASGAHVAPGSYAENITTRGIDLPALPIGTRLRISESVLEVSRIGKECHEGCEIRRTTGDCVMPRRGIFARVIVGGRVGREDQCSYGI